MQSELEIDDSGLPPKRRDPDKETIVYDGGPANRTGGGVYRNVSQVFYGWPDPANCRGEAIYLRTDEKDEHGHVVFRYFGHRAMKAGGNPASVLASECPLAVRRELIAANLTTITGVSERVLQLFGLGTPEAWTQPCFSGANNRLILLGGVTCGAVVTAHDHAEAALPRKERTGEAPDGHEEIVAIEIRPQFRGLGIATEVIRSFARGGRVKVNSPSNELARALTRIGVLKEVDVSIYELSLTPKEH